MIRVVLAVAVAAAIVGTSLPAAERAERDRNAALATDELDGLATTAATLFRRNDPAPDGARATIELRAPEPTLTEEGRFVLDDETLAWRPARGPNRTVEPKVPMRIDRLVVADRARLRLSFERDEGDAVVRVERPNVEEGTRNQTAHALAALSLGGRLSV